MDARSNSASPAITSWQRSARAPQEKELAVPVVTFATGWQTALHRAATVRLVSLPWQLPNPATVSVKTAATPVRTVGMQFSDAQQAPAFAGPLAGPQQQHRGSEDRPHVAPRGGPSRSTRL